MKPSEILSSELLASWSLRGGPSGYQASAIRALLQGFRGVAEMPAGSGKTIVAARALHAIALGCQRRFRAVWLANTIDQLGQGAKAVNLLPDEARDRFDIEFQFAGEPIRNADTVDVLIVDECHHAAAPTWAANIRACSSARLVFGLTATAHREDGLWPEVEQLVGPVVYTVSREVVESQGFTTRGEVRFLVANEEDEHVEAVEAATRVGMRDLWPRVVWMVRRMKLKGAKLIKALRALHREKRREVMQRFVQKIAIGENEARNVLAAETCNFLIGDGHSVLCLVYSVEQGRFIRERVANSGLVFSKMLVKKDGRREVIIDAFRRGDLRCLIATSLADEGLDVPRASALVLASGGRGISKQKDRHGNTRRTARIEQRTARVLRAHEGKEYALIYDFYDHQHSYSKAASWTRFKGYRELGFEIQKPREMESKRSRMTA